VTTLDPFLLEVIREAARQAAREILEQIRRKGPVVEPVTLNLRDAAKYCGLSPSKLARLHYSGRGPPAIRIDTVLRFKRTSLDEFIKKKEKSNDQKT
jgi:hypothetical protein